MPHLSVEGKQIDWSRQIVPDINTQLSKQDIDTDLTLAWAIQGTVDAFDFSISGKSQFDSYASFGVLECVTCTESSLLLQTSWRLLKTHMCHYFQQGNQQLQDATKSDYLQLTIFLRSQCSRGHQSIQCCCQILKTNCFHYFTVFSSFSSLFMFLSIFVDFA